MRVDVARQCCIKLIPFIIIYFSEGLTRSFFFINLFLRWKASWEFAVWARASFSSSCSSSSSDSKRPCRKRTKKNLLRSIIKLPHKDMPTIIKSHARNKRFPNSNQLKVITVRHRNAVNMVWKKNKKKSSPETLSCVKKFAVNGFIFVRWNFGDDKRMSMLYLFSFSLSKVFPWQVQWQKFLRDERMIVFRFAFQFPFSKFFCFFCISIGF